MKNKYTIGIILVLGSIILWSLNSNLLKIIYQENVDPMSIVAIRTPIAALVLLAILLPFAKTRKILFNFPKNSIKYLIALGIIFVGSVVTWMYAISLTTISHVVVLGNIGTIFTLILAYFLLKEKITKTKIIAIIISFMGIIVLILPSLNQNFFSSQTFWGDLIALSHSIFWAIWYLLSRKLGKDTPAIATTTWSLLVASIILLPWAIWGLINAEISAKAWLLIIFTAIIAQSLGTLMLHKASRYIEASVVSILVLAEIFLASLLAYFIFTEIPTLYTYIGGGLIIFSVAIISLSKNKGRDDRAV